MHQHEPAAAEIAGLRQRHREREADRDRRIDGVAAALQNVEADVRRKRLLARDNAMLGIDRMQPVHVGIDRLRILREAAATIAATKATTAAHARPRATSRNFAIATSVRT